NLPLRDFSGKFAHYLRLVHPNDLDHVSQSIEDILSGKSDTLEMVHRTNPALGEIKWLSCRGLLQKDSHDTPVTMAGTVSDITSRKTAEEALAESEARFRLVIEQTGQLVYDYLIETGEISWSGAVFTVTGYGSRDIF